MKRFAFVAIAYCALAGCGDDPAPAQQADDDATARGEVLGGTITDDMLPLDTVTSQSPSQAGDDAGAADGESDPAPAAEPAPAQQAAPAPEPVPEAQPAAAAEPAEEG
ncbi:hypothetical protein [Qipengyuania sphaerica]|uniref:hypothetical protein n=1 Tax=Qipengyuania sphaerica TaxID=2867243 RepID=UPI001C88CBF6|nr:hypothetical protein [Qipengyuania sphaerica]MBX7539838.1 hypothetical protein [Qipengyuania sphaerica]